MRLPPSGPFTSCVCACVMCVFVSLRVHGAGGAPRQAQVFTVGRRSGEPVKLHFAPNAFLPTACGKQTHTCTPCSTFGRVAITLPPSPSCPLPRDSRGSETDRVRVRDARVHATCVRRTRRRSAAQCLPGPGAPAIAHAKFAECHRVRQPRGHRHRPFLRHSARRRRRVGSRR